MAMEEPNNIIGIISLTVNGGAIAIFLVAWGTLKEKVRALEERRKEDKAEIMADVNGIGKKISHHLEHHPGSRPPTAPVLSGNGHE